MEKSSGSAEGKPMTPDLPTLQRKLKDVRQEVWNLQVLHMRSGLSAEELKLLSDLERSARAEVKLRLLGYVP